MKSYRIFHSFLYFLIFFNALPFQAQQLNNPEKKSVPTLTLTNGAEIYSVDNGLNEQIRTEKIVIQNSEISFELNKDNEIVLKAIVKSQKNEKKSLNNQLKLAENKKQRDDLKKVKKEIEKHKAKAKDFPNLPLIYFPSQNQHFSSRNIEKNYVAPVHNTNKDYKSHIADHTNVILSSLSSFNSRENIFHSTKSLQHSFSKTFPVRPPPSFQL